MNYNFCNARKKKCFVPTFRKGPYHGDAPSHTLPLGVNRNDPPPPTLCILQSYILGARIDVNFNFIMHPKPGFSTPKIQKGSPSWEGDTPSHTLPLMSNTLLSNRRKNSFSHPLVLELLYIFSYNLC